MKPSTNYDPSRQLVARKRQVRLDLRRASAPSPEIDVERQRESTFWKWFGFVALLHIVAIIIFGLVYEMSPTQKPQDFELSLLPDGSEVKGLPGPQQAPKIGPSTPAPSVAHTPPPAPTPPTPPQPVKPQPAVAKAPPPVPAPKPIKPKPVVKTDEPVVAKEEPAKPAKPKIKVDLTEVTAPVSPTEKPAKPKQRVSRPTVVAAADAPDRRASTHSESSGLTKEQIAHELGNKLADTGVKDATKIGTSGSENAHPNQFADFYQMIHDQVMEKWVHPDRLDDNAANPVVQIHVEKDGRVPPESVTLVKSSGSQAYDDSALAAAKNLGYLLQPLPDGCPPEITINFKLNR